MALRLIATRADEPVTLAEAKAHLRVEHDDEDPRISALIKVAREIFERETNRTLIAGTYELTLDGFPCQSPGEIMLPRGPIISVTSVKYDDADGNEQTVAGQDYYVDQVSEPGWIIPTEDGWPESFAGINGLRIRFVAGYEATTDSPADPAGNVPEGAKQAMLLLVGHLFENREAVAGQAVVALPLGFDWIMSGHKIYL